MKKIAVALMCFGLFSLSVFAQSGRTSRPRVVVSPTPNSSQSNTTQNSDPNNQNQTKRPPVLIGDSKKSDASQTTSTGAETAISEEDEVIRVETNLVTIPVSVLDRNGRFISGLKQSDFQISEDGVPQKIEYFAPVEQPFTVVLLIDVSPSTAFRIDEIHDAAIAFVNQLRPADRVKVIAFDQQIHVLSRVTNNRAELYNAIRQSNFGDGTSLYEAVDVAINRELRQIEGRKAVVLFTDGVDTTSRMANYQSTIRNSEEADAMIYPIRYDTSAEMQGQNGGGSGGNSRVGNGGGLLGAIIGGIFNGGNIQIGGGGGGNGTSRNAYEVGRRYLEELARTSGGRAFEARSLYNLEAAFSGIAEELRRQYSIGYYPESAGKTGQRKQIKVRTNRTEAIVRAKNSYIVGEAEAKANTARQQPQQPTMKQPPSRLPF
jgi:VWFA-related protein